MEKGKKKRSFANISQASGFQTYNVMTQSKTRFKKIYYKYIYVLFIGSK